MKVTSFLNPFESYTGSSALLIGLVGMGITAGIAACCGTAFLGTLTILFGTTFPFWAIVAFSLVGWLTLSIGFWIVASLGARGRVDVADIFGMTALARFPLLLAAPMGLFRVVYPNFFPDLIQMSSSAVSALIVLLVWGLIVDIFAVIVCYNAFAGAAKISSKPIFALVLIASEVIAVAVSVPFLFSVGESPITDKAMASIRALEPPADEDASRVLIVQTLFEKMIKGDFQSVPDFFEESLRSKVSPFAIKVAWNQFSMLNNGRLEDVDGPITSDEDGGYYLLYLPLRFTNGKRAEIAFVFNDDDKIADISFNELPGAN